MGFTPKEDIPAGLPTESQITTDAHGGVDDFLVRLGNPVDVSTSQRTAWSKDEFQHTGFVVIVFLAGDTTQRQHFER